MSYLDKADLGTSRLITIISMVMATLLIVPMMSIALFYLPTALDHESGVRLMWYVGWLLLAGTALVLNAVGGFVLLYRNRPDLSVWLVTLTLVTAVTTPFWWWT